MPPVEEFIKALGTLAPPLSFAIDAPDSPQGETFIDIFDEEFATEVSFQRDQGFVVFLSEKGFGQRADEVFRGPAEAAARVAALRLESRQSSPYHSRT
jgi:hypothetical protein